METTDETYVVEIDPSCLQQLEQDVDGTVCLYECGECGMQLTPAQFASHSHEEEEDGGAFEEETVLLEGRPVVIRRKPTKRALNAAAAALRDSSEMDGRTFVCDICSKTFLQASNLRRHMRTHTGEKPFDCKICRRHFTQGNNLKAHMRIHSGERPFACSYCDQTFTQGSNLKKHERSHIGLSTHREKRYGCATCDAWFADYAILKAHMRVHTKERPFRCAVCDACFSQESNRRRHNRIHTREKPFACTECGRQFSQGNNLKSHMLTHSGEKPLTCPACGARFRTETKYQEHYRAIHLGEGSQGGTRADYKPLSNYENLSTSLVSEDGTIQLIHASQSILKLPGMDDQQLEGDGMDRWHVGDGGCEDGNYQEVKASMCQYGTVGYVVEDGGIEVKQELLDEEEEGGEDDSAEERRLMVVLDDVGRVARVGSVCGVDSGSSSARVVEITKQCRNNSRARVKTLQVGFGYE